MKKTIALVLLLVMAMTLIMGMVVMADPEDELTTAAKEIQERVIKIVKNVGIVVIIISICLIGFGMLFGGGNDLTKYKGRIGIMFLGIILMVKAESIGNWLYTVING